MVRRRGTGVKISSCKSSVIYLSSVTLNNLPHLSELQAENKNNGSVFSLDILFCLRVTGRHLSPVHASGPLEPSQADRQLEHVGDFSSYIDDPFSALALVSG